MRKLFNEAVLVGLTASCFVLSGCVAVPTSEIYFGNARARFPKDSSADSLEIEVKSVTRDGTTNSLSFKAKKWSTKNNPDVIGASTDQIEAHYRGAGDVAAKAIQAAEKGAAKAVVP